ncbi:hypothetical protein GGH92_002544 [Coemansia sp. RSA 2673]|nr:hypothetical protein GGH92_002544 [Coemansia sp. RSA 2673]
MASALHRHWVPQCVGIIQRVDAGVIYKRDSGHVRWFALALFIDIFVYLAYIPFDPEFAMTDAQQCAIAMTTNRDLTMEYCLGHVHEIKNIAYMMRVVAVLAKLYLAGLARNYELTFPPPPQIKKLPANR